jgi:hypothetical protein
MLGNRPCVARSANGLADFRFTDTKVGPMPAYCRPSTNRLDRRSIGRTGSVRTSASAPTVSSISSHLERSPEDSVCPCRWARSPSSPESIAIAQSGELIDEDRIREGADLGRGHRILGQTADPQIDIIDMRIGGGVAATQSAIKNAR